MTRVGRGTEKKYDMDRIKICRLKKTFQIQTYVDIGENPSRGVNSSDYTSEGVLIMIIIKNNESKKN